MQTADADAPQFRSAAPEHVVTTGLADGIALLDLRTNEYFSLDEVGAFVWSVLQTPKRKDELIEAVCLEYEIDRADCAGDIDDLLGDLADAALVEVVAEPAA